MVNPQTSRQEPILRLHHVKVPVLWKPAAQPVTRLARLTVPDSVREDDEIPRGVEQSTGAEQFTGKFGTQELGAASTRPVHDEHGVANDALYVALKSAKRSVVQPQLG